MYEKVLRDGSILEFMKKIMHFQKKHLMEKGIDLLFMN